MFIKTILAEGFSKIASRAECSISFQGKVIFVSINDNSIIVFRNSFFCSNNNEQDHLHLFLKYFSMFHLIYQK